MPNIQFRPTSEAEPNPFESPLMQRVYAARGISTPEALGRNLSELPSPWLMKDMEAACELLFKHLQEGSHILIVGDFDADGATSATVLKLGLTAMGCFHVDTLVPNRFDDGYGLTPEITQQALQRNPDVIVTVDNGIASLEGVALAKASGVDVLVTDHHLPGDKLPTANAILNPNQPSCDFPSKAVAGVGVVFFLLMALRAYLRDKGWFQGLSISEPNLADYLDLVALGTVADVVPLDHVNRILVYQGIKRIRAGRCRPGIKALLTVAKRDFSYIVASDLGFSVGPRLNAAGRLDDMSVGIACLLADSAAEAHLIVTELDSLNADRRSIEQGMQQEAERAIQAYQLQGALPAGLCIHQADWHQGVVGIVASRVKERYYRPVIAFAVADETSLKGSARSIPGIHIRDVLAFIAAQHPSLIQKFGGHAMAAGLSIAKADLPAFEAAFHQAIISLYCDDQDDFENSELFQNTLWVDAALNAQDFEINTAYQLENAGPWGQQFPEPAFYNQFQLVSQKLLAGKHLKLVLRYEHSPQTIDAIAFNVDNNSWPSATVSHVELVYRLSVNRFRGAQSLQLMVDHIQPIT